MKVVQSRIMYLNIVAIFLTGALVLLFWTLESLYLPKFSSLISYSIAAGFACSIFGILSLFLNNLHLKSFLRNNDRMTVELEQLRNKLRLLEQTIIDLRAENQISKGVDGSVEVGENKSRYVPNQKINLVMHERAFLHTLANKVQIIQLATSAVSDMVASQGCKDGPLMTKQLEVINNNIKTIADLLRENREYLIIAV